MCPSSNFNLVRDGLELPMLVAAIRQGRGTNSPNEAVQNVLLAKITSFISIDIDAINADKPMQTYSFVSVELRN